MDISIGLLKVIRQREDMEENDESRDDEFRNRDPIENLRAVTGWYLGDGSWAITIMSWAEQLGVTIERRD